VYEEVDDVPGIQFLQHGGAAVGGTDGITHERITCYTCQSRGHYSDACPDAVIEPDPAPVVPAVQLLQVEIEEAIEVDDVSEFTFAQQDDKYSIIPSSWVLLDSQSTVSVFRNAKYLKDIRKGNKRLKVHTNGGTQFSSLIGDTSFGEVWYNPNSLANILSMAAVRKQYRITMDRSVEAAMYGHRKDGTMMKFKEFAPGLYYYDADKSNSSNSTVTNYSHHTTFVQSFKQNKEKFTNHKIQGADAARKLYRNIRRPSEADFRHILRTKSNQKLPSNGR